jgi:Tol biopolymer transport system component
MWVWARLGPAFAAAFVVAVGLALWGWLRSEEAPPVARYNLATLPGQGFVDGTYTRFDVAPRGAAIVYAGPGEEGGMFRLWVKEKGQLEARPLPGTEGAGFPSISPDATEVVFTVGTKLRKVPLQGGAPIALADSAWGATWMEDGTLVYSTLKGFRGRLRRIPASGGTPEELWPEQPENRGALFAAALPDSRGVLFTLCDTSCATMDTWVLDLRSGQARQLVTGALRAWYLDPGYLVFIRPDGAVFALPFDVGALQPTGTAVPLLEGVKIDATFFPDMALRSDGTLLLLLGGASPTLVNREMVWVSRAGEVEPVDPSWRFANARNTGWALSPDGSRLAVGIHTDEGDDIWIKELDDGPLLRLTQDPAEDARPGWSPDGESVYFASRRRGNSGLFIQRADAAGEALLLVLTDSTWQADLSPDGRWVVARRGGVLTTIGGRNIVGYRLDQDTTEVPLLMSDYDEVAPQLSPDGRWLAYASRESGQYEINVRPFPDVNSSRWVVSSGGGSSPRWARSGRELFYVSADSVMMVAGVEAGAGFRVSGRRDLFKVPAGFYFNDVDFSFDVTPDDQRFIMQRAVAATEAAVTPPMVLIENWGEEVKARVRAQRR